MIATDGCPQSNINPKGHTPMNTTTRTATRYLNIDLLNMADLGPTLMPGDTIHVEATLVVRSVTNGLDWRDNPTETVSAKPADGDGQQVVIRTAHMQGIDGQAWDGETGDGPTAPEPKTEPARLSWLKRHAIDLKIGGGILGFTLWVASIAMLVVILAGCSTGSSANTPSPSPAPAPVAACDGCAPNHAIPAVGEECTKVGTYNVSIKGKRLYCAEATAKRAARGDTAPRWITA